jgi:hypothetical protein
MVDIFDNPEPYILDSSITFFTVPVKKPGETLREAH